MIVFGSRGSDLALTQTRDVAARLTAATGVPHRIEVLTTRGDAILDRPLPEIGGKGLFTAELEDALRERRIDVAVHSLKDLPVEPPEGLVLGAVPARAAPHDVLLLHPDHHDDEGGTLPLVGAARIGTSSPRRAHAIRALRKDLTVADLRGNVPTRADKARRGDYAAVVLAAAGLDRLALPLDGLLRVELPVDAFVPAPGQGALGVQCRADDPRIRELLATVHDPVTAAAADAERALLLALGGGCSMPFGCLVRPKDDGWLLLAGLYTRSGSPSHLVRFLAEGPDLAELVADATAALLPLATEPLAGHRVVVARPGGGDSRLEAALAVAGAAVDGLAVTEALPVPVEPAELAAALDGAAWAFTSARAVDRTFELLAAVPAGARPSPVDGQVFAVGAATAAALAVRGHAARIPAEPSGGAALAAAILASDLAPSTPIAQPSALDPHPGFRAALEAAGRTVRQVPVYRIEPRDGVAWPDAPPHCVVWTSPSSVDASPWPPPDAEHVAIGASTAAALDGRGIAALVADEPTPDAVRDAVARAVAAATARDRHAAPRTPR